MFFCLLFAGATSLKAESPPEFMVQMEFVNKHPAIPPASFAAKPRKLWRAGDAYFASLETPDYENGIHGLIVTHEPHSWMVNLFTRSAKHILDTAASQVVRAPVFSYVRNDVVRKLEFGREVAFFLEHKAKHTAGGRLNGIKVDQYDLDVEAVHLKLIVDSVKRVPLQVQIRNDNNDHTVEYLSFDDHVKFDPSVFVLSPGISVEEAEPSPAKAADKKDIKNPWMGDFMTHYYQRPDPSRVADSLRAIKEDRLLNDSSPLFNFYAPIMRNNPELISSWVQVGKELGSGIRQFIYFALRECGSEQCLNELRKNPYGYDEQGMKVFSDSKRYTVETVPLNSPGSLDYIWADFLATGSDVGVRRIARLVGEKWPLFESKSLHGGELLVVGAARWSLVSNAEQHQKVLSVLKEESDRIPALKKVLGEVRSDSAQDRRN